MSETQNVPPLKVVVGLLGPDGTVGEYIRLVEGESLDFNDNVLFVRGIKERAGTEVPGKIISIFPMKNVAFISLEKAFGDVVAVKQE